MDASEGTPVRVGEVTDHADRVAASALLAAIWGVPLAESPVPADLMTALTHAGGCVLGAWTPDGTLVGVTIGFAGAPGSDRVYSYIAGVASSFAGRGLGRLLKLAQRDWALERGAAYLTWTYDPLIRRNGYFNLNRLGGRVTGFVQDYYPPMLDAVNAGDLPDRFVVDWTLADEPGGRGLPDAAASAPVVLAAEAGHEPAVLHHDLAAALAPGTTGLGAAASASASSEPGMSDLGTSQPGTADVGVTQPGTTERPTAQPGTTGPSTSRPGGTEPSATVGGTIVRAWVPSDIEGLRGSDPDLGRRWRLAAREVFGALFAGGYRPVGIDAGGHYVFLREV